MYSHVLSSFSILLSSSSFLLISHSLPSLSLLFLLLLLLLFLLLFLLLSSLPSSHLSSSLLFSSLLSSPPSYLPSSLLTLHAIFPSSALHLFLHHSFAPSHSHSLLHTHSYIIGCFHTLPNSSISIYFLSNLTPHHFSPIYKSRLIIQETTRLFLP